jgi:hypothetical protein
VGRVLVENGVALVLLLSVKLALELADTDLDAVSAGAASLLHVAIEETRCSGELPVESVVTDGQACVELGHFDIKAPAFGGGNETELNFASSSVV